MYELVNYSNPSGITSYFKLIYRCDFDKSNNRINIEGLKGENITDNEEIERISLSRTKRHIKEIALCNDFDLFATLTIDSAEADRFSLSEVQDLLKKQLKKLKRYNKEFRYIFITEKHKNGAFHFHGLIGGLVNAIPIKNKKFEDWYINNNGYVSHQTFDNLGFNSFSKIKDYNKCCNYITKYITKECVRNEANQIYISSRGLKKAIKEEINPVDLTKFVTNGHNLFTNDFCSIVEFSADDLSSEQKLYFINNVKNRLQFRKNIDINMII